MIEFTCVFSQHCISVKPNVFTIAIFASNKANRIPIQLLQRRFNEYFLCKERFELTVLHHQMEDEPLDVV
jgi:hypothetical protein